MKPLPLALFLVFSLPIVIMPGSQGEGSLISPDISTPLGEISMDTFFDELWTWIKEKSTDAVEWVGDGIVSIFETIKSWHYALLASIIGPASNEAYMTANLLIAVAYVLALMGAVRIWVLILDIMPIF